MTRRTKIVATLGPATASEPLIERLVLAGMDVARVNFSHGTRADHARQIEAVRRVAGRLGRPVAVLQDLQGPKIRVGWVEGGGVELAAGAEVTLVPDDGTPGGARRLGVSLHDLGRQLRPGTVILIDDGRIRLRAMAVEGAAVHAVVEIGGLVKDHKGVNIPNASLDVPVLTDKDLDDVAFGVAAGVDYVALSFVRTAADVRLLRECLARAVLDRADAGSPATPRIVAKIEKHEALQEIDAIIAEADAVMIARGDLGVEIPPEEVPRWQKTIIRKAMVRAKAVITATQMLESMIESPTPTRAEASDVANAVWDGTSAVMLSGETAVGRYPVEAVETMARIAAAVEADLPALRLAGAAERPLAERAEEGSVARGATEAISRAACRLAEDLGAAAVLTPTQTGTTARRVSRFRPRTPIVATTPEPVVQRQLMLEWGVTPLLVGSAADTDGTIQTAVRAAVAHGVVRSGDLVVVTCGARVNVPGSTNLIKLERVEDSGAEERTPES